MKCQKLQGGGGGSSEKTENVNIELKNAEGSDRLRLKEGKFGIGVVSKMTFKKGDEVYTWPKGRIYYRKPEDFHKSYEVFYKEYGITKFEDDHSMQVAENMFMLPVGSFGDFFNHSCSPNCGIRHDDSKNMTQITLVAIRNIEIGEEMTWDYATNHLVADWELDCECGTVECRKKIGDWNDIQEERVKQKYRDLGLVSYFLK